MAQQQLVKHAVTYKGKEYEVQEKPEEDLECCICLQLAYDPCQTSCCGQTLCSECDDKLPPLKPCPCCRNPSFQVTRDARIKRKIRSLTAYCPNHSDGCNWLGSIVTVNDHLKMSCPEQFICCQFVGCPMRMKRKRMAEHIKICPAHPMKCPNFCAIKKKLTRSTLQDHIKICPAQPMTCPNHCSTEEKLTRSTLQDHLNNNCPEELIFCEFTGCRMKMKRKKMVDHIKSCPAHPMTCPNHCSTDEKLTRSTLQDHLEGNCPEQVITCQFGYMCRVRLERKHMAQHVTDHIYEMKQVSWWLSLITLLLILCFLIFKSYMSGFVICITLLSFIATMSVAIKISYDTYSHD